MYGIRKHPHARLAPAFMGLALLLSGCDKFVHSSKEAQSVTMHAFSDTKDSWKEFFTYHPPQPDPLPQTRYCYQFQSDIVCYDSVQKNQTAKLIGYQDGENISWVQPGGGSLGASGGPPIALRPARSKAQLLSNVSQPQGVVEVGDNSIYTGPVGKADPASRISVSNASPAMATHSTKPKPVTKKSKHKKAKRR